jgi:nucleoside phosphorylase
MQNIDVLLVTSTEVEARPILNLFPNPQLRHIGDQTYHDLGSMKGAKIFMVQSEMGSVSFIG